ncbi:MAG: DUF2232 domain-containing protein [Clostridia bacterium]
MEKERKVSFMHILFAALIGSAAFLGAYVPLLLLLLPAFLAFVAVAWGNVCFAIALAAAAIGVYTGCGGVIVSALYDIAIFAPAAVIIALVINKKQPHRVGVAAASGALALGGYLLLCLPSLLAGKDPFALLTEGMVSIVESLTAVFKSMSEVPVGMADALEYIQLLPSMVPEMATMLLVGAAMVAGFANYIIAYALSRRTVKELKPMAPFRLWQLSRSFTWGALILLLGAMIVTNRGMINAAAISVAVQTILVGPFALSGMCFFEFIASVRAGSGALIRIVVYAAVALMMPYSIIGLAIIGMADRIFHIRKKYIDNIAQR